MCCWEYNILNTVFPRILLLAGHTCALNYSHVNHHLIPTIHSYMGHLTSTKIGLDRSLFNSVDQLHNNNYYYTAGLISGLYSVIIIVISGLVWEAFLPSGVVYTYIYMYIIMNNFW